MRASLGFGFARSGMRAHRSSCCGANEGGANARGKHPKPSLPESLVRLGGVADDAISVAGSAGDRLLVEGAPLGVEHARNIAHHAVRQRQQRAGNFVRHRCQPRNCEEFTPRAYAHHQHFSLRPVAKLQGSTAGSPSHRTSDHGGIRTVNAPQEKRWGKIVSSVYHNRATPVALIQSYCVRLAAKPFDDLSRNA